MARAWWDLSGMRSWRPFCCGFPGLIRSIAMPRRSHQTANLERLKRALGLAKGTPLSDRMAAGSPNSLKARSKTVKARSDRRVRGPAPRPRGGRVQEDFAE